MSGICIRQVRKHCGKIRNVCLLAFSHFPTMFSYLSDTDTFQLCFPKSLLLKNSCTVKPVLETTCIKRPPALRDHCCDRTTLLKST